MQPYWYTCTITRVWCGCSYPIIECKGKSSSRNLFHDFPDLRAYFPCPVELLHRHVVRWYVGVTDITCPPSSTFFRQMAPLEASPAKYIGLSMPFSFGKGFFWKLNTKIQFVILLTEETDDAFRVACAGCRSSSSLFLRQASCEGSSIKVSLVAWIKISSSRVTLVGFNCLYRL